MDQGNINENLIKLVNDFTSELMKHLSLMSCYLTIY